MGFWSGDNVSGSTFGCRWSYRSGFLIRNIYIYYQFIIPSDITVSCTNSADAIVTVNALPIVTADPKSVCIGSTVLLTGPSRWGLEW
jgi:hypothetical protein